MAEGQSKHKDRLNEVLVLAFVIVTAGLLVVQLGMNVAETLAQANRIAATPVLAQPAATLAPTQTPEPSPTFDLSSIEIQDS